MLDFVCCSTSCACNGECAGKLERNIRSLETITYPAAIATFLRPPMAVCDSGPKTFKRPLPKALSNDASRDIIFSPGRTENAWLETQSRIRVLRFPLYAHTGLLSGPHTSADFSEPTTRLYVAHKQTRPATGDLAGKRVARTILSV